MVYIEIGSCYFNTVYTEHVDTNSEYKVYVVEPIKEYIDRYKTSILPEHVDRFVFINKAVLENNYEDERINIYHPSLDFHSKSNDRDYDGMATIKPDSNGVSSWGTGAYTTTLVDVIRVDELMNSITENEIYLLKIDTEGYDYNILKDIDFGAKKILNIIIEHKHCVLDDILAILIKNNYSIEKIDNENVYCKLKI